ncbi:MAG: hypothetical protein M3529_10230, partial [Actinomycetota bacterium]|nr:hypothetical protein [Actinomycetota bacterium]
GGASAPPATDLAGDNVGDETWRADECELGLVVVRLTDPDTGALLHSGPHTFAEAGLERVELSRGGSARLPVTVCPPGAHLLAAGSYGLTGLWPSLDLCANPGRLRLHGARS